MAIYETFSKRIKRLAQTGQPDVYQYEDLPQAFRVKVALIWKDVLGTAVNGGYATKSKFIWDQIHDAIAKEKGVFYLGNNSYDGPDERCIDFLLSAPIDEALDIIELSFRLIRERDSLWALVTAYRPTVQQEPDAAIQELNHRFREHGIGYQFVEGDIIRVDSQYLHAEAVKPALSLLSGAGFQGASAEFLEAHEHHRKGEYADAIADALKAFESTMKAICDSQGWDYPAGATAKTLIKTVLDNGLLPSFMQTHLAGLRNTLEAGLPVVRNKLGGRGQGKDPKKVHDYFASYALHLAATNIVFLVEAHDSLNK